MTDKDSKAAAQLTDHIVVNYLSKRGFKGAENLLRQEAKLKNANLPQLEQDSITNFVLFYNEDEVNNPKAYDISYSRLVKWVEDSIDIYKLELRRILYPIFVHAFLDLIGKSQQEHALQFFESYKGEHLEEHGHEILLLSQITDHLHLQNNQLVSNFRENKFNLIMSKYSFELLLCFLQDNKYMLILRLMNQYITIEATSDKPGSYLVNEDGMGLLGTNNSLNTFNQQALKLGPLPKDKLFYGDVERALNTQLHSDGDALMEQVKAEISKVYDESSPAIETVPFPPKKLADIVPELNELRDIRARVKLSDTNLPSICCYTFHNAGDYINCLKASSNADFIAAGFSDSLVKLWSVTSARPDLPAPSPKNLVGHSGPVYGLDFSSCGNYLISSSEDKTVRLWSMETKTNVVCYKGHNYPVFDVEFSPHGFYFATASLDKTARLWSVDHLFPLRIFVGHLSDVDVVKFHPNSNYIVTGSGDHTCRMWDIQKGNGVRIFAKHTGPITAVAMSPTGKLMASAASDNKICLWDLGSGNCIKTMDGHEGQINSLEFSQNGEVLASGSSDDTVRVWRVNDASTAPTQTIAGTGNSGSTPEKSDQCLKVFPTKRTPVYSVSFTKRNIMIALGVFQKQ